MLWRGINTYVDYDELEPLEDRKPVDTAPKLQKIADDFLESDFGWRPRSSGVFAYHKFTSTTQYGTPYMVFPTDGFEYVWSMDVIDFFMAMKHISVEIYRTTLKDYGFYDEGDEETKTKIDKIYDSWEGSLNNDYLEPEDIITKELWREMLSEEWLKNMIKPVMETYINDDLEFYLNMKDDKEIIIKCDSYFIVSHDYYEYVKKYFNI